MNRWEILSLGNVMAFYQEGKTVPVVILSGIHGEEPAGPQAIMETLPFLSPDLTCLIIPQANLDGLSERIRFGTSPYLGVRGNFMFVRELIDWIVDEEPAFVLDLHEDDGSPVAQGQAIDGDLIDLAALNGVYLYQHGGNLQVQRALIAMLANNQVPLLSAWESRFGEKVEGALIQAVEDDSIDDWIWQETGVPVTVVETPAMWPLRARVNVHKLILWHIEDLIREAGG